MTRYYFVGQDNKSYGPITPQEFASYGLTPESLVCPEGGNAWVPLHSVPGLTGFVGQDASRAPEPPRVQAGGTAYGNGGQPSLPPPNYMVWAILVTIFCCLPLGIVAIVKSSEVNSLWYSGRHDEAMRSSQSAKKWCMYSCLASVIVSVLYVLLLVGGAVAMF